MKKLIVAALILAVGAFAWFSLPPLPQKPASGGHASHGGDPKAFTDGVVVAVDAGANNVTISHGPIQHLGMPGMTMGFNVSDPALLRAVKPGDKVRFQVDVIGGAFTVLNLEPAN